MNRCPLCLNEVASGLERCPRCDEALAPTVAPSEVVRSPARHVSPGGVTSRSSIDGSRFVAGDVLAGRYRIVGLLGRGGMGEVYRAEDLKLQQTVALKFVPDELLHDGAALARFHREVRVARQVSHPNVCRVFDFGEADGHAFLTMEYIDGEDLSALLRRIGRLPEDKALEIARQLCAGLAAAHDAGVLHRDLKPANIMLDGRGRARLTDFGLAGLAGELRQEPRAGTPAYMSPEQQEGRELTSRSDIYALGLVLYELFTGRRALAAGDHGTHALPPPSAVVSNLDPAVDHVVLRCLEPEPARRPHSALQVAAALPGGDPLAAALAAGETPSPEMVAAAPTTGTLTPAAAMAAVAAVVALVALIAGLADSVRLIRSVEVATPPAVLEDRARSVLEAAGWGREDAASAFGFEPDWRFYEGLETGSDFRRRQAADPDAVLRFWYRRSPRPIVPSHGTAVTAESPPLAITGDALVLLDAAGRLRRLVVVPEATHEGRGVEPPWRALLERAGFEPDALAPETPLHSPPVFADELRAWAAPPRPGADLGLRIESAAHRGRVVFFDVAGPWAPPPLAAGEAIRAQTTAGLLILLVVAGGAIVAAAALARRNLQLGRGDRRGAARLAMGVLVVSIGAGLLGADHVADLGGEYRLMARIIADAAFRAGLMWLLYIAIEPALRRTSPHLVVAWSRLLAGGWRDPLVGRDVLIGGLLGLLHTVSVLLTNRLPLWIEGVHAPPLATIEWSTLTGARHLIATAALQNIVSALFFALLVTTAYLLLLRLLQRRALAIAALWLLYALLPSLIFLRSWSMVPATFLLATAQTLAVVRFGLVGTAASHIFFVLSLDLPLAFDARAWYVPHIVLPTMMILGLAVFGARLSVGHRRRFGPWSRPGPGGPPPRSGPMVA